MDQGKQLMGLAFQHCRIHLKYSQRKMAQKLQVNQSTICRIETGTFYPRKKTCVRLEKLMNIRLIDLTREISELKLPKKSEIKTRDVPSEVKVEHLSPEDLQYLKDKSSASVWEIEESMNRDKFKLKRLIQCKWPNWNQQEALTNSCIVQQNLISFMQLQDLSADTVHRKQTGLAYGQQLLQDHTRRKVNQTKAEVFLRQMELEEQALIREFRAKKARELEQALCRQSQG